MEPAFQQPEDLDLASSFPPCEPADREIVSLEECRRYVGECGLSDERILEIRNNMVGIVDRIINAYLERYE